MGTFHASDELVVVVETLRVLVVDKVLDIGKRMPFLYARFDIIRDDRILFKRRLVRGNKILVQHIDLEYVAGLRQDQKLFFRHDLAEFSVTVGLVTFLVIVRETDAGQLLRMRVADVDLVRPVGNTILIGTQMIRQLF